MYLQRMDEAGALSKAILSPDMKNPAFGRDPAGGMLSGNNCRLKGAYARSAMAAFSAESSSAESVTPFPIFW